MENQEEQFDRLDLYAKIKKVEIDAFAELLKRNLYMRLRDSSDKRYEENIKQSFYDKATRAVDVTLEEYLSNER